MIIYIFCKITGQLTKNIFHVIAKKKKIFIFGIFTAVSQWGEVDRKEFTERVKQITSRLYIGRKTCYYCHLKEQVDHLVKIL